MMISEQLTQQKKYLFERGPLSFDDRKKALKDLKKAIKKYEDALMEALQKDLGKPAFESYTSEIGFLYSSIEYTLKHLKKWMRPKKVRSDNAQLIGSSYIYPSSYGVVLIMSPFNYPVQLLLEPLVGAIAGGNGAILKPSELTPSVEKVLVSLIESTFDSNYISIVTGDINVNQHLLSLPVDYIFFTGSARVGKFVMKKASEQLIPVTLELGGKSPVIVDESVCLKLAAKRIAWGKFMNNGQTCVAPDYLLVHDRIYEAFLEELKAAITQFYGENPLLSKDYGRIVNRAHTMRLASLIEENRFKVVKGGVVDIKQCYISPTLFSQVTLEDSLMEDEIFGPLLPILRYRELAEIDACLEKHPHPLAFYVFSQRASFAQSLIQRYSFGGGCINDVVTHVASNHLPFGGVSTSGMGRYHGKASFDTFTYSKSIVKRSTKIPINLVFPPYRERLAWIKKIMR